MGRQKTQHSLMAIPKVFNSLNSTGYTSQHHAIPRNHESFNLFLSSQLVFFLLKNFFRGSATKSRACKLAPQRMNIFIALFKLVIYRLTYTRFLSTRLIRLIKKPERKEGNCN